MTEPRREWVGRPVITGMGLISALGTDPETFHAALDAGETGLSELDSFSIEGCEHRQCGQIDFEPRDFLPTKNLRPLDRTGRLVACATSLALEDSGWTADMREAEEIGLVLGTMFCSVRTIAEFDRRVLEAGPKYASPFDFANSVINAAGGQAAIWHSLRGPNSTIAGGPAAGVLALGCAAEMIRSGRASVVVAGGADELCHESFLGMSLAGLLCPGSGKDGSGDDAACSVPLDARRNGFCLAEGAGFLVLEDAEAAKARGARILAEVSGHGSAYDPSRGRDATFAAKSVARSQAIAMEDACVTPEAIDALSLAANGSVDGDRYEACGVRLCFGERAETLPVTAIKSMLGEALGASGAFQAIAMVESMRGGRWPGIRGLDCLGEGLPLPSATDRSCDTEVHYGLINGQDFDGNTASVVLQRYGSAQ